jgi:hypothetical protein
MFFDIRQIKHISNVLDTTSLKRLTDSAYTANTKQATVGKIINGKYTTEFNNWCTADFVDYSTFTDYVDLLKPKIITEVE